MVPADDSAMDDSRDAERPPEPGDAPLRSGAAGTEAARGGRISPREVGGIARRVMRRIGDDHLQVVAAGIAFYVFLSLFPALASLLSFYGLFTSPEEVTEHLGELRAVVPDQAYQLIHDFAVSLTSENQRGLGWGALAGILISVWSSNKGTKALFDGINLAYNEPKRRGFLKSTLLTFSFTLGSVLSGGLLIALIAGLPALRAWARLPPVLDTLFAVLRWPLFVVIGLLLLALVYAVAPQREVLRWRWLTPGAALAMLLWLAGSLGFGWYLDSFGNMARTYGSLAAIVILMLWFFIAAFAVLLGAEVNSVCERRGTASGRQDGASG